MQRWNRNSRFGPAVVAIILFSPFLMPGKSGAEDLFVPNAVVIQRPLLPDDNPHGKAPTDPPGGESAVSSSPTEDIDARVRRLVAQELGAREAIATKPGEKSLNAASTIDLADKKWSVKLGGHVQMDFVHWTNAEAPPIPAMDYFEFRRLRLVADGSGYGVYDFRLQIDIEPEGGANVTSPVVDVKDAYLSINQIPLLNRFRIGNFFVPFSLEQVTNDTLNIFVERSIPTQGIFAADREVGLAVYGFDDGHDFSWTLGVFLDDISESLKERIDDNQGYRLSGRLTWLPYYDEIAKGRHLIHTGAGILYTDDQDDLVRFRARPQIHEGPFLIDSGEVPARSFTNANIEFATVLGSTTIQSEHFLSRVHRIGADPAILFGGYLHGSYFLTGENRVYEKFGQHGAQFGRNVPNTNFYVVPGAFGPGAWEVKARMSYLSLEALDRGFYYDFTLGFNWYWSDRIRIMFDWIHPITNADTTYGATSSDLLAMRFDWNW